MLRKLVTIAIPSLLISLSPAARADAPARDLAGSHVIVSADRMMPLITYESVTVTDPTDNSQSASVNALSIALVTNGPQNTILTMPRFGLDFVVSSGVTLGLSAWVATTLDESFQIKGQSSSQDLPKSTLWGVASRLGYILPMSDNFAFWPRAGIEYYKQNTSTVQSQTVPLESGGGGQEYQFSLDVEGALVFAPVDHFGFTFTAYCAIPLVGGISGANGAAGNQLLQSRGSFDASQLGTGLTVGLLGYL
jgi:hypothetical protein